MEDTMEKTVSELLAEHSEIPTDHKSSWDKYPKFRWVYETTRLLDMQGIEWSPYRSESYVNGLNMFNYGLPLGLLDWANSVNGSVVAWVPKLKPEVLMTTVAIFKGEAKYFKHVDVGDVILDNLNGDIELRINAMLSLHFQKFTGVIDVQTFGKDIVAVNLYVSEAQYRLLNDADPELFKHIVRIYNNRPWGK